MASLSMTCLCGRTASAPCPTVADILTVRIEGWGNDERGSVRCPECAGAPLPARQVESARKVEPAQLRLFGGEAA